MAEQPVTFTLSYDGSMATSHQVDLYDVAHALAGFQRSLAITTHLLLNGEVITQAPSLRGAQILALPAEDGSWKLVAALVGGIFALGQAPQNSAIGHLITSAYDYVVSETLGFHVDFAKTLGQQYEDATQKNVDVVPQPQSKFDAVIEKCETSIKDMHRPIVNSRTASNASIIPRIYGGRIGFRGELNISTFEYINITEKGDICIDFIGRVSSYNSNTYKGRIFVVDENRPVPFELGESARDVESVRTIVGSLMLGATARSNHEGFIVCKGFRNTSRSGRLKSFYVVEISR